MDDNILFIPTSSSNAKVRLFDFIQFVKNNLPSLIIKNNFDSYSWSVQGLTCANGNYKYIYFTNLGTNPKYFLTKRGKPAAIPEDRIMKDPYCSFCKAMIVYMHIWDKTVALPSRMAAFRYIEHALITINGNNCPTAITPEILNFACNSAANDVGEWAAYNYSHQIGLIYKRMIFAGLVASAAEWSIPLRAPKNSRTGLGDAFEEKRNKKLPSPQALQAIAEIFTSDTKDLREIFLSSICALLICAPDRSSEILLAPANLLAEDWVDPDTGEVGTGLRWFPAKNGAPMVKTVIPAMREIAKSAVENLVTLSAPARKIAIWYEANPCKIYLPQNFEYLRDKEFISPSEAHSILFEEGDRTTAEMDSRRVLNWLRAHDYTEWQRSWRTVRIKYSDLERLIISDLPEDFPIADKKTGMLYSEALCITRKSELSTQQPTIKCCIEKVKYNALQKGLKSSGENKSVFERRNYRDSSGKFIELKTHMFRHYLNTLAQQSGALSEEDIANWSGRKNTNHNATYNHESDRDLIAKLSGTYSANENSALPFIDLDNRKLLRRDQFLETNRIAGHTTENGHCVHDFVQTPCQVAGDCINCPEHICIKGDARSEKNIRALQAELLTLRDEAKKAFSEEVLGAAEWYKHQQKSLERVNQIVDLLDDPNIPNGSIIQLSDITPASRITMAKSSRNLPGRNIKSLNDIHLLLSNPYKDSNNDS